MFYIHILLAAHKSHPILRDDCGALCLLLIACQEEGTVYADDIQYLRSRALRLFGSSFQENHSGNHPGDSIIAAADSLVSMVRNAWAAEKEARNSSVYSPLPWSSMSRAEYCASQGKNPQRNVMSLCSLLRSAKTPHIASPSAERKFNITYEEIVHAADFTAICIPDMPWLGGPHDGYPPHTTLSEYTSIRWPATRSIWDNQALWQGAMTFGVLEAITMTRISESDLLYEGSDGHSVFVGRRVSRLFVHWIHHVLCDDVQLSRKRAKHCAELLSRALLALDEVVATGGGGVFPHDPRKWMADPNLGSILCSIATTLQVFIDVSRTLPGGREAVRINDISGSISVGTATLTYIQRMVAKGWCPKHLNFKPLLWLAYANTLPPPIRDSPDEHLTCTKSRCTLHSIDTSQYTGRHRTPDCLCDHLLPPISAVSHFISNQKIPAITYENGKLIVRVSDNIPYVAISHVWADGLGSTSEKGLPTCQIEHIAGLANQLLSNEPAAFWVDSLCVPEKKDLRKSAIRMMAETYRRASKVLVFDAGIRTLCSTSSPPEENLFRISTSGWMQRVWTLQEALLAQDLFFELANEETVSARQLYRDSAKRRTYWRDKRWAKYDVLSATLNATGGLGILLRGHPSSASPYSSGEITALLSGRTTSKPEDESVAVAGLLGIDAGALLNHHDNASRVREFYSAVRTIPAAILFAGSIQRLSCAPFRWSPRSLTDIGVLSSGDELGDATCSNEAGLTMNRALEVLYFSEPVTIDDFFQNPVELLVNTALDDKFYSVLREFTTVKRSEVAISQFNAMLAYPKTFSSPLGTPLFHSNVICVNMIKDANLAEGSLDITESLQEPCVVAYGFMASISDGKNTRSLLQRSSNRSQRNQDGLRSYKITREAQYFRCRVTVT